MARYTETVAVDKPYEHAWNACRRALLANGATWSITGVQDNTFFLRERIGLVDMFFRNSCRIAIIVQRHEEQGSSLVVWAATFGIGPLPKARLRRTVAVLKSHLQPELDRPPEPE